MILNGTRITEIHSKTFHDLPKLKIFRLGTDYSITIHPEAFYDIPELKEFHLVTNSPITIHPEAFYDIPKIIIKKKINKTIKEFEIL